MIRVKYLTIVCLSAVYLFGGCRPKYCSRSSNYEKRVFSFGSLTGRYELTGFSKQIMRSDGGYRQIPGSTLRINADSTYVLTNAPDWLNNALGTSFHHYFSKKGKLLAFACNHENCFVEFDPLISADILVSKNSRKITMLFAVGDPDSCQGMAYEKH